MKLFMTLAVVHELAISRFPDSHPPCPIATNVDPRVPMAPRDLHNTGQIFEIVIEMIRYSRVLVEVDFHQIVAG